MLNKEEPKVHLKRASTHGLPWKESPWPWEYVHLMPRRELVSRTPKTATEVALFGRLLTVTSLKGVSVDLASWQWLCMKPAIVSKTSLVSLV